MIFSKFTIVQRHHNPVLKLPLSLLRDLLCLTLVSVPIPNLRPPEYRLSAPANLPLLDIVYK